MRNREQYQDFLKCLSLFSEEIISKGELLNLVADSLSRHPDLGVSKLSLVSLHSIDLNQEQSSKAVNGLFTCLHGIFLALVAGLRCTSYNMLKHLLVVDTACSCLQQWLVSGLCCWICHFASGYTANLAQLGTSCLAMKM